MIIDTHAHYDDEKFDNDRAALLGQMQESGIGLIVNAGSTLESWDRIVKLTEEYPFVYGAIGIHPDEAGTLTEHDMERMRTLLDLPKIVAAGEIGLDYYWDKSGHDIQKRWFIRQLEIAREKGMPVIIHSREAAADTMEIMKEYAAGMRAVIHCYSYSPEMAEALKMLSSGSRSLPSCWRRTARILPRCRTAGKGTAPSICPMWRSRSQNLKT